MNKGLEKYTNLVKEAKKLGGPEQLRKYYYARGVKDGFNLSLNHIWSLFKNNSKI